MSNASSVGPVIVDIAGLELQADDRALLANPWVGGLILFSRNYESVEQLKRLTATIKSVNPNVLIAVDHEGGRVQRFRDGFSVIPPMQAIGKLYTGDKAAGLASARELGWLMAAELIACGLDISFAPVLDIDETLSDIIGDRSFSVEPGVVTILAGAFMAGMHEAGMATTGKHFPGHGGVKADSHLELPVDTRSLQALEAHDIQPFKELLPALDALMPAHILFPSIDAQPVGFSSWWIKQYLKERLGFNGIVFSDDLSMEGATVAGGYGERALAALAAGCDSILVCNNRAGAREVLDVLNSKIPAVPQSGLETMLARKTFDLAELKASNRWQHAQTILEKM